jgi:hypothetical protein
LTLAAANDSKKLVGLSRDLDPVTLGHLDIIKRREAGGPSGDRGDQRFERPTFALRNWWRW